MTTSETTQLTQALAMYAAYYRQTLPDEVLRMYAGDLSDFDFARVREALEAFRKNPKNRFMPLPAQIRELLEPQVDPDSAAREIAARVHAAIPKFGYMRGIDARAYIGEVGWNCVERQGGWSYICEHHGLQLDPGVFQAQVRELAKSELTHNRDSMAKMIGLQLAPGARSGEMQSIGEIMSLPSGDKS